MMDFGPFSRFYFNNEEKSQKEKLIKITEENNASPEFFNPTSYQEATNIADCMQTGKNVIVNLEILLTDITKKQEGVRIVDYLCGVAYILKMNVMKINQSTFYFSKQ